MSEGPREPRLVVEGPEPEPLDRDFEVIGRPLNRLDGVEKVTGRARYAGDLRLPGMLFAKIVRCPHAHARITRIDASRALALPGVRAVISRDTDPDWLTYWYMIPQPAFPGEVGYAGGEVAAVAADDPVTAARAADLVDVNYEVLPTVFSVEEALRPGAPLVPTLNVKAERDGNVQGPPFSWQRGDVAAGLAAADVVIDEVYRVPSQFHVDIQTRTCIADWDGQRLTVHDSAQGVWNVKLQLAQSLGLDPERVRVNVQYMGGGFGSKAGAQRYAHYAARLAMVTGRPVKLEMTRREEFLSHPRRYSGVVRVRLGARRDGTLTAIVFAVDLDLGAGTLFRLVSHREMVFTHVAELYACPAVAIDIRGVYTNTPPTGPQRGVLNQVASYTMEAAMDTLARALDRDPVEVRLRNDSPWADPEARIAFSSKRLTECADAVIAALGWERRAAMEADNRGQTRKRGLGIAFYAIERAGVPPYQARAEVLVTPDGKVELRAGVVEIGAGQVTVLAMLAAEELGVDPEAVRVVWGDTDGTLYAPSSHASRVTIEMGPAVLQAAALARRELFRYAGPRLDAPDEEVRSGGGRIYVKSADWRSITFAEACRLLPPEGIRSVGSRGPNPENPVLRAFGVQGMEVEVDEESGEIRVVRVVSAHDIGRALNPKLVESQHHGAILMGLGYGRWEEPEFDPKTGRLLNTDVHQYRIPTALETPAIEVINIEGEDRFYPYSAKPLGEAPFLGVAPAFRNAVLHATGLHINELPITVPRLLEALESRHRSGRAG